MKTSEITELVMATYNVKRCVDDFHKKTFSARARQDVRCVEPIKYSPGFSSLHNANAFNIMDVKTKNIFIYIYIF